ncbi:MAG: tetratricopeptide repeat protein [Planctomycetota bacterium]
MKKRVPDVILIIVAFSLASLGVWGNGPVRDDHVFLVPTDTDVSWTGLRTLMGEGFFPGGDPYYYRPLTRWLFRLENLVTGGSMNGYHLINLSLYALLLALVNEVLRPWFSNRWARITGLLLVGLHPATHSIWVYLTGTDILPFIAMSAAILLSRIKGWRGVVASSSILFLGCFAKESGVLGYPLVLGLYVWNRRGREAAAFFFLSLPLGILYLVQRSGVVATPQVVWQDPALWLAILRESFWAPVLALLRPDLCQQENFVRVTFEGATTFSCIAGLAWLCVMGVWLRSRQVRVLAGVGLYWLFFALVIPNSRPSLELSDGPDSVLVLYVPDHLLFVPLLVIIVPCINGLSSSMVGRGVGTLALVAVAIVGLSKQGEWRDEESLFRAIVKRGPATSKPYKILAYRLHQSGRQAEALAVVEEALSMGFKNSELFHVASSVAASGNDPRSGVWLEAGAREAVRECQAEIPFLLASPDGKMKVLNLLELRARMFPFEPWFRVQQGRIR